MPNGHAQKPIQKQYCQNTALHCIVITSELPSSTGQWLAATWWLFAFILIASYTANVAAYLSVERMIVAPSDFDDLYNTRDERQKYAPIRGTEAHTWFTNMKHQEETFYE